MALLVSKGDVYECSAMIDGNQINLIVPIDRRLTKAERASWQDKLPNLMRYVPDLNKLDRPTLTVESRAEIEERLLAATKANKNSSVKMPQEISAAMKSKAETREVGDALRAAGISRAKFIRVLDNISKYGVLTTSKIKEII